MLFNPYREKEEKKMLGKRCFFHMIIIIIIFYAAQKIPSMPQSKQSQSEIILTLDVCTLCEAIIAGDTIYLAGRTVANEQFSLSIWLNVQFQLMTAFVEFHGEWMRKRN